MSYLLDALRKADHERQLGTVPDLATAADPGAASEQGTPVWLVIAIAGVVALNGAVLGAVMWRWFGGSDSSRLTDVKTVVSAEAEKAERAATEGERVSTPQQVYDSKTQVVAAGKPERASATEEQATSRPAAPGPASGSTTAGLESTQKAANDNVAAASASAPQARELESTGVAGAASYASPAERYGEVPWLRELPQAVRKDLPEYTLNGLLYSSVPGVSFVLINGGRYHEGERIPGAGAVVTIHAEGVVINYKGRRFRLPAPD